MTVIEDFAGAQYRICTWQQGDRNPVRRFLDGLPKPEQRKVLALMQRAADHGLPLHNKQKCRQLSGQAGLYEFKSSQVRLLFFVTGDRDLILTNGFLKKRGATPRQEIDRAARIRALWEQETQV